MRRYAIAAGVVFLFAILVAVTGGVKATVFGYPISSRRVVPACLVAWAILLIGSRTSDQQSLDDAIALWRTKVRRRATTIAVAVAVGTFLAGVGFGALTSAGADPFGYVSQADLWARGNPVQFQRLLALDAPWPNAEWSFCPLGYKPSFIPGLIVPTYASGLPLQMAALMRLFGNAGGYLVVPIAGAFVVWLTFVLARRIGVTPETAVVSAILAACSPVFLFQLMQPMSDVPVTAWWLAAIVAASTGSLAGAIGAGVCASIAVLTRPNLVALVIPLGAYLVAANRARISEVALRLLAFAAALIPGIALAAAVNATFYGAPTRSGYGSLPEIYSASFAGANLVRYPAWLWQTQSPYVFLALAAPLIAPFRRHGLLALLFAVALLLAYLFYLPFDHWTYLRFVLPAVPLLLIFATATVDHFATALSPRVQAAALGMVVTLLATSYVHTAVQGEAFALKSLFRDRYPAAAAAAGAYTPDRAVVFSLLQSGSLRWYADRLTVRYDLIEPAWLEKSTLYLKGKGLEPYVSLESSEIVDFGRRFGDPGAALLRHSRERVLDPMGLVTLFGPLP